MNDAEAVMFIARSGVRADIDAAKVDRRLSCQIDGQLWDGLYPVVRQFCGPYFQSMERPWRSFMLDGVWVERAK